MGQAPNSLQLLLAFYGDDFTGSTDALEFMTRAGARSVLFIAPPSQEQLARYPGLQAIGVAGMTRSMPPDAIERELRPAFLALRDLGAPHVHYKVCSTFDSSPTIGSIGRAIDIGAEVFGNRFIPLLVGAPPLGRYCLFGNLFARMGIGTAGQIYRLDRHPSMSRHPVTPADEADLRIHLARQTNRRIGLFDILNVTMPPAQARAALDTLIADGPQIVLFDVLDESQLMSIGELIDAYGSSDQPLFSVGSSGVEMALGAQWASEQKLRRKTSWPDPGPAGPMLVLSGSCSPTTESQIAYALSHGFVDVPADIGSDLAGILAHLESGRSVIVHTARGPNDPRIRRGSETAPALGSGLGRIGREIAERMKLRRVVVAGGDTSSFAARAMGMESLEMIAPIWPGAPLCRACAPGSPLDGAAVIFKGGQVGGEDFFSMAASGRSKA